MLQSENLLNEFDFSHHISNLSLHDFSVYFQPIFSSRTAKIYGYEAIPKIHEKFHYFRNLISDAGREGCLFIIDLMFKRNVFREAIRQQISAYIFIKICHENLQHPENKLKIIDIFAETFSFPKDKIVIEIPEKYVRKSNESLIKGLNQYRKKGFKVAIDDFGSDSNYSKTLSFFAPDFVKIDEHFTHSLNENIFSRAFIEFTVSICRRYNILVVAEGIKTMCQLRELLNLEVDLIQGPYFNMPQLELAS